MKSQYLASFSVSTAIAISMILTAGKSAIASKALFYCQSNDGMPTTVAKSNNGAEQAIFHWNLDQSSISRNSKQLCDSVTQKLNNYAAEGNDLSSLTFKASSNDDPENLDSSELPVVCVAEKQEPCALELFALNPVEDHENPTQIASVALNSILDPALQTSPKARDRGVQNTDYQNTDYQVDFWKLLGF